MIQDDTALVERVLSGDKAAFGPLTDRYWPKAMSLALRRLGNFADAEDTVQNAFLRALLDLLSLRSADRFGSWLLGIVVNLCRMHKRTQRNDYAFNHPTFDDVTFDNQNGVLVVPEWSGEHLQPSPEALYVTQEAHRALLAALATLPAEQQRTV
jgi:RNA polymerase sigma factor (sigma-70 family)